MSVTSHSEPAVFATCDQPGTATPTQSPPSPSRKVQFNSRVDFVILDDLHHGVKPTVTTEDLLPEGAVTVDVSSEVDSFKLQIRPKQIRYIHDEDCVATIRIEFRNSFYMGYKDPKLHEALEKATEEYFKVSRDAAERAHVVGLLSHTETVDGSIPSEEADARDQFEESRDTIKREYLQSQADEAASPKKKKKTKKRRTTKPLNPDSFDFGDAADALDL